MACSLTTTRVCAAEGRARVSRASGRAGARGGRASKSSLDLATAMAQGHSWASVPDHSVREEAQEQMLSWKEEDDEDEEDEEEAEGGQEARTEARSSRSDRRRLGKFDLLVNSCSSGTVLCLLLLSSVDMQHAVPNIELSP